VGVLGAVAAGFRRASASPLILIWLWLVGVAAALPATWSVYESLRDDIGKSRVHENLRDGFDIEWYGEYSAGAQGLASTFRPTVIGAGGFYDNLEGWLQGAMFQGLPLVVGIGVMYALVWALFLGGALDRYAHRCERVSFRRYFAGCGRFFFRFVRLAFLSAGLYASIYIGAKRAFDFMKEATLDVTAETTIFFYSMLIWLITALLLTLVHMVFGYAKVVTVVENRRSMLLASLRALGFVVTRAGKTLGLYFVFIVLSGVLLAVYPKLAPGPDVATYETVGWAFAIGQGFLIAKLFMRLSLLAGQTALYQAETQPVSTPSP
jgi:hypothetical protein